MPGPARHPALAMAPADCSNRSQNELHPSAREFEQWLAKNHAESTGIWLRFFKKNSGVLSVSYAEAVDAAICFGWIDGQLKKYDQESWLRKFTPRRPKSVWSKRNRE